MPALSFSARFADAVLGGKKKQTVRRLRKRPFQVGDKLSLYSGMRTKKCRPLGQATCTRTARVVFIDHYRIAVDGEVLSVVDQERFAEKDGFQSRYEMHKFFFGKYGDELYGMEFQLIQWEVADEQDA